MNPGIWNESNLPLTTIHQKGMHMNSRASLWATSAILGVAMMAPAVAAADSGFYLGGSVGNAGIDVAFDPQLPNFDETDNAYKLFAGYNFQLTALSLGIEGEPTGFTVFGVAALGLGPVDLFGKVGYLAWDYDAIEDGEIFSDDGSDTGYGVGLRFNVGSIQIRGEYEVYEVDEADLSMVSVGIAYRF